MNGIGVNLCGHLHVFINHQYNYTISGPCFNCQNYSLFSPYVADNQRAAWKAKAK